MIGPVRPTAGALRPLGLDSVRLHGAAAGAGSGAGSGQSFWGDRQALAGDAMLPHCRQWVERVGWVENLRAAGAGGLDPRRRTGRIFSDSDVYKLVEAMAWESARRGGDPQLDAEIDALAGVFAAAQQPDGYLHTGFGRPGQPARYSDLEWGHELYCYGHLIQAAVARLRGHEEDELVRVAVRAADHVCDTFAGAPGVGGHPEIEMALVELYRATGERRYLEQARRFVDRRGRHAAADEPDRAGSGEYSTLADIELGRSYFQDDLPVRKAYAFAGHAVRALYLACGAVDVAVETGDEGLLAAVVRQWQHTVAARTYLTGGMGARADGEAFGADHELPSDGAYAETCAAIASVMLSWRLVLATGEVRYADLAERTLYNAVAVSPARDGRSFFYRNPLQQRVRGGVPTPDRPSPRAAASLRAPWFEVSCCPTNLGRMFASLGGYLATVDGNGVQLHQYASARVQVRLPDGRPVTLSVMTGYPWSGAVTVRVVETTARDWTLSLRVPTWAPEATVRVVESHGSHPAPPGDPSRAPAGGGTRAVAPGWAEVTRAWRAGDEVRLSLPVNARWTWPDPRIDAVRGQVALERGPLVYCAESVGRGAPLDRIEVTAPAPPVQRAAGELEPGAVALRVPVRRRGDRSRPWPYGPPSRRTATATSGAQPSDGTLSEGTLSDGTASDGRVSEGRASEGRPREGESVHELELIPYHLWANRGPATMRVWLPRHSDDDEE